ncbi:MAG: hypothetical protein R6X02_29975 [Enhygromyxa sp.]
MFARAADLDRKAWKHAYNLACVAALDGRVQWARIALGQALVRDRAAVSKRALKDKDLDGVRGEPWFAAPSSVSVDALKLATADPVAAAAGEVPTGPAPHYMYYDTEADFRAPLSWWPGEAGDPGYLLIPHRSAGIETFTIASKTAKGWMATTIDVVDMLGEKLEAQAYGLVGVRRDYLEIFVLAWAGEDPREGPWAAQRLCRIRWERGALRQACADSWNDRSP